MCIKAKEGWIRIWNRCRFVQNKSNNNRSLLQDRNILSLPIMVVWSRSSVSLTSLTELSWMERLTEDSVLFDSDTRTDGCRWKGVESVLWIQSICYRHRLFCFAGSGSSSYKKVDFNLSNICLTTRHSPHKKTIF